MCACVLLFLFSCFRGRICDTRCFASCHDMAFVVFSARLRSRLRSQADFGNALRVTHIRALTMAIIAGLGLSMKRAFGFFRQTHLALNGRRETALRPARKA